MAGEEEHPRDSPFNCRNRAKGGVWYKWQGKKNHPRDSPFNCRNRAKGGESGINGRGRRTIPGIALLTAVTGLRGESGINGRGRRTTHSWNWIVLLQRIVTKPLN